MIERVHKPTVLLLFNAGVLPVAAAARAMLLAYYHLSSKRGRPCTVSCRRIAADLGADPSAVRYALLRWEHAQRLGENGQRRRAWKLSDRVTTCHAPQEEARRSPPPQNSVTPPHAIGCQTVTSLRDTASRPTTEIELEKKNKEIARHAPFSSIQSQEVIRTAKEIARCERLITHAEEINTAESLRNAEKYRRRLAELRGAA